VMHFACLARRPFFFLFWDEVFIRLALQNFSIVSVCSRSTILVVIS
jgi:hypothetical protein